MHVVEAPPVQLQTLEEAKNANSDQRVSFLVYVADSFPESEVTMNDKAIPKREISAVDSAGNELIIGLLDDAARATIVKKGVFLLICRAKANKFGVSVWSDASIDLAPSENQFVVTTASQRNVL